MQYNISNYYNDTFQREAPLEEGIADMPLASLCGRQCARLIDKAADLIQEIGDYESLDAEREAILNAVKSVMGLICNG